MASRLPEPVRRALRPVLGPAVRRIRTLALRIGMPAMPAPPQRTLDELVEDQPEARESLQSLRGRLAGLESQVSELRGELAVAGAGAPAPPSGGSDLRYLFVVTYGRSGSTLLQGVLNSIPGYLIRGENRDALGLLYRYHHTLTEDKERFSRRVRLTPVNAWYGIDGYPEDVAIERTRSLVVDALLRPRPDTRVVGFKEIRWRQADLDTFLEWMDAVFPGMRVIVNSRDHDEVLSSGWWATSENGPAALANQQARIDAIGEHFGERAYRLHYDDWVHGGDRLDGLFEWLGEPVDHDRVAEVLARRHAV